jgi:single-strand DNA-binding protein
MQSTVTLVGNVVTDVTLRHTSAGAVAGFRMAATNGYVDRRSSQWVERTTYLHVSAWRGLGENVAGSLHKGQPVVVVGRLRQREYEKDGQTHQVVEVDAELVGHDLTRGTATFVRTRRGPQTADLARESLVATELSGDGDTRSTYVTDGSGWAVPGLAAVAEPPAADPAA